MGNYQRKIARTGIAFIIFTGVIALVYVWYMEEQGNFHAITPGEAYRSAQMDRDELQYYVRTFGIHSIINLRGKNPGSRWYTNEVAFCKKVGVRHYDFDLDSSKAPTANKVMKLLCLFRTAQRPVLIHCDGGADRSSLAAALWKVAIDRAPKTVAAKQLSIWYGHLPFGPTQALDRFFKNWKVPKKSITISRINSGM